ncbi:hypothetical protein ACA910_018336 [Epithemia clementina (nom. ined.)]
MTSQATVAGASNDGIVLKSVDVLLGRGKGCYEHIGNQTFMRIITSFVNIYTAATSNKDKIRITDEIVSLVHDSGGRFLAIDNANGELYEVSYTDARMKVSQALRHRRPADKKRKTVVKPDSAPTKSISKGPKMDYNPAKQSRTQQKLQSNLYMDTELSGHDEQEGSQSNISDSFQSCPVEEDGRQRQQQQQPSIDLDAFHVSEFSLLELDEKELESLQISPSNPARTTLTVRSSPQGLGANKKDLKSMMAAREKAVEKRSTARSPNS